MKRRAHAAPIPLDPYNLNRAGFTWLLFWIKYLDFVIARYKAAHVIHAGAYLLGRKPAL